MNILYLAIQHTYTEVQLGLYKNNLCLGNIALHKNIASALLTEKINELLQQQSTQLNQLAFMAINQGPGPFTTLRVVIATANGISFALGTPLIGVDGIQTLINEYHNQQTDYLVALLNAFNKDVYFAIKVNDKIIASGSQNIDTLLEEIKQKIPKSSLVTFIGNGALMHADTIIKQMPNTTVDSSLLNCSLDAIARAGLKKWQLNDQACHQLLPLYIKNNVYDNIDISQ